MDLPATAATAPASLADIAKQQSATLGVDGRATVYILGPDGDAYGGFVFRAEDDYFAEPLDCGFYAKPPVHAVAGTTIPDGPAEWIDLAERLKAHEDVKPAPQRVPIGGQLDLAILMDGKIQAGIIHQFD